MSSRGRGRSVARPRGAWLGASELSRCREGYSQIHLRNAKLHRSDPLEGSFALRSIACRPLRVLWSLTLAEVDCQLQVPLVLLISA